MDACCGARNMTRTASVTADPNIQIDSLNWLPCYPSYLLYYDVQYFTVGFLIVETQPYHPNLQITWSVKRQQMAACAERMRELVCNCV